MATAAVNQTDVDSIALERKLQFILVSLDQRIDGCLVTVVRGFQMSSIAVALTLYALEASRPFHHSTS